MLLVSLTSKYKNFKIFRNIKTKTEQILQKITEHAFKPDSELLDIYNKELKLIKDYIANNPTKDYDTNSIVFDRTIITITAVICQVCKNIRDEMPFTTQIQGALALNYLQAIELSTGQGKTLTAVLSAIYRSAWSTKVHIVTANDYLAYRDFTDMKDIYDFFNIKSGYITRDVDYKDKIYQYSLDVVYISNHEIGFDYLKSNMQYNAEDVAIKMEDFQHVIIDEMDLILIDNARIPTIISTTFNNQESYFYKTAYKIVNQFEIHEVDIDYKDKSVFIKLEHVDRLEILICQHFNIDILEIYSNQNIDIFFYIDRCLKAKFLFKKNHEYIVSDSEILVIDEYTGRIAGDRKFSMGIHQALEAAENLKISAEGISTNYITTQNIYRKYKYMSGMTGTIITDKEEIEIIYRTNVLKIPSYNKNMHHAPDIFFTTKEHKYQALAQRVKQLQENKQPVLIGTSNIQESEEIAHYLKQQQIKFNLLNAKSLDTEAKIISEAGRSGSVTLATNLAGRGTDIKLGGNVQRWIQNAINKYLSSLDSSTDTNSLEIMDVKQKIIDNIRYNYQIDRQIAIESGGLCVLIAQKQENRRIEQQFRGRAGRIQDPGYTQTYVSLEDDIFIVNKVNTKILKPLMNNNEGINHMILSHLTSRLQKQHEKSMFYARINVMNQDYSLSNGREVFFKLRNHILNDKIDIASTVFNIFDSLMADITHGDREETTKKYQQLIITINSHQDLNFISQILKNRIKNNETNLRKFIDHHNEQIVHRYLKILDHKWSIFINSKETKKRIASLQSSIDYILDYNYYIYKLFIEILGWHEVELAKIAYEEIEKYFV